jgi:uncharacterized membrane protein
METEMSLIRNPFVLVALIAWSLAWKGLALWRAARNDSKPWFVVLLLVNTLGVLEILYLFVFGRRRAE